MKEYINTRMTFISRSEKTVLTYKRINVLIEKVLPGILLTIVVLWAFLPIVNAIIGSFKEPLHVWDYPPKFFGRFYSMINYQELIGGEPRYFRSLINSLIVTLGTVLIVILCSVFGAYVFSRFLQRFVRVSALFTIIVRMIPPIIVVVPLFPILNALGLVDNRITLVMLYAAFMVSMSALLMKTFIDDVPVALEEAALIDGCSRLQAFFKITLPLSAPGIVAVVIFTAIFAWNEYLFAFVFTSSEAGTAPLILSEFMGALRGVEWGMLLAAAVIHLIPMLILTWIMQSYLIKGMSFGAVKQ